MADVSGILAAGQNLQNQQNPLGIVQGYQNLANSVLQNKIGQQQLQTQQQQLATTRANQMAQKLYAVNALPDSEVAPQAQRILDDALQGGTIDQNHYAIGQKIISSGNVGQIRQYATLGLIGTLAGPDAINRVVGQPYIMNNGQSLQPGMIAGQLSPNAGAFTPSGQATQVYPSRSELLTQQPGVDSEGAQTNTPLVVRAGEQGQGGLTGPAGVTTQTASPTNQPRLPGAVPPAQPAGGATGAPAPGGTAPPAPQGAPAPSGAVRTSLPPGSDIPLKQSAQQYADDRQNAATYASRTFPLQAAISLYKEGTSTGPGSDWINNVRSFISSRASNLGLDIGKVQTANFDELNKYLTQYVTQNPMAAGSDARLASALTGNPSTHISTLAGQNVARAALALERMKQAAIVGYNGTPQGYANYMQNYATHVDPRAFAVDLMSPAEQQKMVASMKSPQERLQFQQSYETAKRLGLLQTTAMPPNQ
jgi:hypothetical protein